MKKNQNGFGVVEILVTTLIVVVIGLVGLIAWKNSFAPKKSTVKTSEIINSTTKPQPQTEYEYVKINNRNFRYPVNDNTKKIIIIPDASNPALKISYEPIRAYYATKNVSDDCKSYNAGLVNVDTEEELTEEVPTYGSVLSRIYSNRTIDEALSDGTLVRIAGNDLYVGGPFKHNELCTDIYENKDAELQNVLMEVSNIRLSWFKLLELVD